MATTESGIYYQDDYNVPADILTDMKKMAESTDKVVKENKYNDTPIKTDLQAIKQEQQDQNSKIENNTTENKDNTELLKQIMGLLPSAKGEGEHVTLDNTGEARFKKFEVQGNSKQETRSGKNKIPYPYKDLSGTVIKDLGDGRLILNGTLAENTYKVIQTFELKTGKYKLLFSKTNIPNGSYVLMSGKVSGQILQGNKVDASFELTEDDTVTLGISILKGTYNQAPLDLMILEATEQDETFEQYGASPSPEFPSKIRNVGDNVNFFNKDGNTLFEYDVKLAPIENGIKGTLTVAGTSKYCVMKLGGSELLGKTLIVHGNAIFSGKNDGLIGFYFGINNDFVGNWITDSGIISKEHPKIERIFKIPDTFPEGRDTIYILLYANGRSTEAKVGDYVEYRDLKIEEGTQATAYSPYNCGNAEVTVYNKNLYDNKNANVLNSPIDSNGIGTNAGDTYKTIYIPCKPNTTYTVSKLYDVAKNRFALGYTNTEPTYSMQVEGYISNANVSNLTITTGKNAKYLLAYVWITGGTNTYQEMLSSIQIEENAEATNKIENKQQTIVFPFSEGQRLYKGDYLAEDGIHHVRKQTELTETSGWSIGPLNAYRVPIQVFVGDMNRIIDGDKSIGLLSDRFVPKDSSEHTIGDEELYSFRRASGGLYLWFFMPKSFFTATTPEEILAEWKTYLKAQKEAGTPVVIEYELANEVVELYTPEQQEAYDKLKKLHSYNEQTNIFSVNEIGPIFNLEAIKNLNVAVLEQTTKES